MTALALFFAPFIAGLSTHFAPKLTKDNFKPLLVFAASYLFAITIIHTLPELYEHHLGVKWLGLLAILGFLLQYLMEEIMPWKDRVNTPKRFAPTIPLLLILCMHAFLEGAMLAQPPLGNTMLLGIVLHRAPVAFVLMVVLSNRLQSVKQACGCLIVFSIASPFGLWAGEYIMGKEIIPHTSIFFLYALMSGTFLYLFIAIITEKTRHQYTQTKKILMATLGLLTAVAIEYVLQGTIAI